ncbi:MAG: cell division protein SepF [Ilumatobacteraceae bacterium]
MSFWKKTMDYLGLGPDDAYDDYDEHVEPEPPARSSRSASEGTSRNSRSSGNRNWPAESDETTIRAVPARPSFPSRDFESPARRAAQAVGDDSGAHARSQPSRSAPRLAPAPTGTAEPSTVRPRRFDQAQELADKFKDGQAVILNLEAAERDVARRLIDFASGVCYSLDGSMEKVATGVYLLKPAAQRVHRFDDYES